MSEDYQAISMATLRRLPRYLFYLRSLRDRGVEQISASQISAVLDVQHTQVRKDLAVTGAEGTPKVGHSVTELIESIESFLNWNNSSDAFLVGVGNLGAALLGFKGFEKTGIRIVAAFDSDPEKIGRKVSGVEVLDIRKLPSLALRMHVHIGILTVSEVPAQEVAQSMVDGGILAIWNFAPVQLSVPPEVIVENMEMQESLALLSFKLKNQLQATAKKPKRIRGGQ